MKVLNKTKMLTLKTKLDHSQNDEDIHNDYVDSEEGQTKINSSLKSKVSSFDIETFFSKLRKKYALKQNS